MILSLIAGLTASTLAEVAATTAVASVVGVAATAVAEKIFNDDEDDD